MNIAGKRCLVTGAATGIGRAGALALAAKGAAAIILADIDADGAAKTAQDARDLGAEAIVIRADLSKAEDIERLFGAADRLGGLDILFNNAGVMSGPPAFPDTPPARIPFLLSLNLTAIVLGSRLAMDGMRRRGGGVIVNTSSQGALRYGRQSVGGRRELWEDAPYAASKAGVQMFTQTCAPFKEMFNIRVNCICPGVVETPILASTGEGKPAAWLEPQLARTKALTPERVAEAMIQLIEDDSKAGDFIHIPNEA